MKQEEIIRSLRNQSSESMPRTEFITNLRTDLMKGKKKQSYNLFGLWGLLAVALLVIVVAVVIYLPGTRYAQTPINTNPTDVATPAPTATEQPAIEKDAAKRLYITSAKRYFTFHYPEEKQYKITYDYVNEVVSDSIEVKSNTGKLIMTIGPNWLGFSGTPEKVKNVTEIKTTYLGTLYRSEFIDPELSGYWRVSQLNDGFKLSGTCKSYSAKPAVNAPCMGQGGDIIKPGVPHLSLLIYCEKGTQEDCDMILKGLQVE